MQNQTFKNPNKNIKNQSFYEEYPKPKRNSPAHQRAMQDEVINTIENTEFFNSDMWDKLEQYDYLEKESNKELEANLKRQKEIEKELKKQPQVKEEQKEELNENKIQKEDPLKDRKLLEDELKNLKNKEKDLKNRVEEAKNEVTEALTNAIRAKDIGELIRALIKAYQASCQKRVLNDKLKDNLDEKALRQKELLAIKRFHGIAKDIENLSSNQENKNFVRDMCLKVVGAREEAKKHKHSLENAKEYYKKFENCLSGYEMKNEKGQALAKTQAQKLFNEVKEKCPEYRMAYKTQFRKVDVFLNPEKATKQEMAKQRLNNIKKAKAYANQARMAI